MVERLRIFVRMIRKQPHKPDDYLTAHSLVNDMEGGTVTVTINNVKAFRKYISDLGSKKGKRFYTRKAGDNSLLVGIITD